MMMMIASSSQNKRQGQQERGQQGLQDFVFVLQLDKALLLLSSLPEILDAAAPMKTFLLLW